MSSQLTLPTAWQHVGAVAHVIDTEHLFSLGKHSLTDAFSGSNVIISILCSVLQLEEKET